VVTAPQVVSVIHTGTAGDADVYTATVSVTERPYASAQSTRSFYRVPVSMWNYQPRALTLPARINGPGPGADFRTAYPQALSADSPVFTLVRGFPTTYLTRQHTLWHKSIFHFVVSEAIPGQAEVGKVSPNIGSPLWDSSAVASSWMTSQCSASRPSWILTMSATIQFAGCPTFENRPCSIT
jgi:hypothetical protein